jgi:Protein of unknown function (DUF2934)
MDDREEKIRVRAYEIWEHQGQTGDPEDHWLEAERELKAEEEARATPQDPFEATVEEASPVEAFDATNDSSAKSKRSPKSSKG